MKNIYCCGFYPLIGLLSSNLIGNTDKIYYLRYTKEEWMNPNEINEKWLIDLLSKIYNINIFFSPLYTDKNKPEFEVNEGDYISENIINFMRSDIKKKMIYCVAEGSSGLRHLFYDVWWLRGEIIHNRNIRYILFDDYEKIISKTKKYNVKIIDYNLLRNGFIKLKDAISKELNFDFDQFEYIFCPFLLHQLDDQFNELSLNMNNNSIVLIKKHPSDFRTYDQFLLNKKNYILLDEKFNLIPLELFFINEKSKFIGFYSTATLFIPINRVTILNITSNRIKQFLKKEGSYIHKINNKRILQYKKYDRRSKN
jgi:hypothetical protein